jgi:DUF1680 family protein
VPGTQHPTTCGAYIYSHPLAGGSRKVFGDAEGTFWCCYGTGVEAFARLSDGIYFLDDDRIHVRQFVASEAVWTDRGIRIVQTTKFPYEPGTRLTIYTQRSTEFEIRVRIPIWARGATCSVNGIDFLPVALGGVLVRRRWKDGDVIELTLPMSLRSEQLPGDPSMHAFLYGPVVLAARTPHSPELGVPGPTAAHLITPTDLRRLHFQMTLVSGVVVPLVPLGEIVDEALQDARGSETNMIALENQ